MAGRGGRRAELFIVHVIDDDEAVRGSLDALLSVSGYLVLTFGSAEAFLDRLDAGMVGQGEECILLDVHMPGMTGLDLLQVLVVRPSAPPVLLLTASRDDRLRDHVLDLGAVDCLTKPVSDAQLLAAIEGVRNGAVRPRHA